MERLIERDSATSTRLDELSRLDAAHTAALAELSIPLAGFPDRIATAAHERINTYATIALVADLLGLGWHTGRAVLGDPTVRPEPDDGGTGEG
ncbi:MAG: hypothetical protein ACRD29_15670 [Acidimicrobiales bacterium]